MVGERWCQLDSLVAAGSFRRRDSQDCIEILQFADLVAQPLEERRIDAAQRLQCQLPPQPELLLPPLDQLVDLLGIARLVGRRAIA
jgi:hypothetical protein